MTILFSDRLDRLIASSQDDRPNAQTVLRTKQLAAKLFDNSPNAGQPIISICPDQSIHLEWSFPNKKFTIEIPCDNQDGISYLLSVCDQSEKWSHSGDELTKDSIQNTICTTVFG